MTMVTIVGNRIWATNRPATPPPGVTMVTMVPSWQIGITGFCRRRDEREVRVVSQSCGGFALCHATICPLAWRRARPSRVMSHGDRQARRRAAGSTTIRPYRPLLRCDGHEQHPHVDLTAQSLTAVQQCRELGTSGGCMGYQATARLGGPTARRGGRRPDLRFEVGMMRLCFGPLYMRVFFMCVLYVSLKDISKTTKGKT